VEQLELLRGRAVHSERDRTHNNPTAGDDHRGADDDRAAHHDD
jgi:hypothetical protein